MNDLIVLQNITKKYGKKVALRNVSISIGKGKIIGLLGPNGSGKTTLIKTIMRIIRQQEGQIYICGEKASYLTRKYISFMPDREFLYDSMTIKDAMERLPAIEDVNVEEHKELIENLKGALDELNDVAKDYLGKDNIEKIEAYYARLKELEEE